MKLTNKLLLITLIIINLLFAGCNLYEKPILVSHAEDIHYIVNYYPEINSNTMPLLSNLKAEGLTSTSFDLLKNDGTHSYQFISVMTSLQAYEDAYYTYLKETPSARKKTNDSAIQVPLIYSINPNHLAVNITNTTLANYIFDYDLATNKITIITGNYSYLLSDTLTQQLLDCGLFNEYFETPESPFVSLVLTDTSTPIFFNEKDTLDYYYIQGYSLSETSESAAIPHTIASQASLDDLTTQSLTLNLENYIPSSIKMDIYDTSEKLVSSTDLINLLQTQTSQTQSSQTNLQIDPDLLPLESGEYKGILYITYTSTEKEITTFTTAQKEIEFFFQIFNAPVFESTKDFYQAGDLILIKGHYIENIDDYTIESDTYHLTINHGNIGDDYIFMLPLTSRALPGEYTVYFTHKSNPELSQNIIITLVDKEFEVQYLETSSQTASIQNDDNYAQLNEAFARGRATPHSEQLWDSVFLQPVGGRISTEYGVIRFTNDNVESSRHNGIDFANPEGTIIYASHNGYVSLAEYVNITGNTLFIDHGLGIYSQYYHMSTIYVEVGQYVEKGDPVGEVGTTGFSTGPHLHFSIYYSGVYLNPWNFFEEAPF